MERKLGLCEWTCSVSCQCELEEEQLEGRLVSLSYDRALIATHGTPPGAGSSLTLRAQVEDVSVSFEGKVVFQQNPLDGAFGVELAGPAGENCRKVEKLFPFLTCPSHQLDPGFQQKRRWSRWKLALPAFCRWEEACRDGQTVDLSLVGARIRLDEPPAEGTRLEIRIESPRHPRFSGRVVYRFQEEDPTGVIGVELEPAMRGGNPLLGLLRTHLPSPRNAEWA